MAFSGTVAAVPPRQSHKEPARPLSPPRPGHRGAPSPQWPGAAVTAQPRPRHSPSRQNSPSHPSPRVPYSPQQQLNPVDPYSPILDPRYVEASKLAGGVSVRTPVDPRGVKGASKLVLIGVSYRDDNEMFLPTAIHDIRAMQQFLTRRGFAPSERLILTEEDTSSLPTRVNILSALRWLVRGSVAGDSLFLHFSGHGARSVLPGEVPDSGLEDGEALAPMDYRTAGLIRDDELFDILVGGLAPGARLTAVFDCCRSGAMMELPFKLVATDDDGFKFTETPHPDIPGQVFMVSYANNGVAAASALTTAFIAANNATPGISNQQLVADIRTMLRKRLGDRHSAPAPQLCCSRRFELSEPFTLAALPQDIPPPPSSLTAREEELMRRIETLEDEIKKKGGGGPAKKAVKSGLARKVDSLPQADEVVGAARAVFIGISYRETPFELDRACDITHEAHRFLMEYGFNARMQVLTEECKVDHLIPTRINILSALRWLSRGAAEGEALYLHFVGHGPVMPGVDTEGLRDAIAPLDYYGKGYITGDEMYSILVRDLPPGVQLTCVFDLAHGGTGLELPYTILLNHGGGFSVTHLPERSEGTGAAVTVISAVSSDAEAPTLGGVTSSFINTLTVDPQPDVRKLLEDMQTQLSQIVGEAQLAPQVSTSRSIDERALFHLGTAPQNLRPRRQRPPEAPDLSPVRRHPPTQSTPGAPPQGPGGSYTVKDTGDPAAVVICDSRFTMFCGALEGGEKTGSLEGDTLIFDNEEGEAKFDGRELHFSDGMVWVKQIPAGDGGDPVVLPTQTAKDAQPPLEIDEETLPPRPVEMVLGASKTLLVGVNYYGQPFQLSEPAQDVRTMHRFLQRRGFNAQLRVLCDNNPKAMPTRANILSSLRWLARDAVPGDSLFLMLMGHGAKGVAGLPPTIGLEEESFAPVDFAASGMIRGDEIMDTVARGLPAGVRLTMVVDLGLTGSVVSPPFSLTANQGGGFAVRERPNPHPVVSNIVVLSLAGGGAGSVYSSGALTTALMTVLNQLGSPTYDTLLDGMRMVIQQRLGANSPTVPRVLSTLRFLQSDPFYLGATPSPPPVRPFGDDPLLQQPGKHVIGAAKALLVGIGYGHLANAPRDARELAHLLLSRGFNPNGLKVLVDDGTGLYPGKANIVSSMRWLARNAEPGDSLFFYFCGYGAKVPAGPQGAVQPPSGSTDESKAKAVQAARAQVAPEESGVAPSDWATSGMVHGNEIINCLLAEVPAGARLTALFDCAYGMVPPELPFTLSADRDGGLSLSNTPSVEYPGHSVIISTFPDPRSTRYPSCSGNLTQAFVATMDAHSSNPSYAQLLSDVRLLMEQRIPYSGQLPRVSSTRRFDPPDAFHIGAMPTSQVIVGPPPVEPFGQSVYGSPYRDRLFPGSPSSPPRSPSPVHAPPVVGYFDPVKMAELNESMREIQQSLNDALHVAQQRGASLRDPGRQGTLTPTMNSPVGGVTNNKKVIRRLKLNNPQDPLGMRLHPVPGRPGMTVESVAPDSPAFRAGVQAGDIVSSLGGYPVDNGDDVRAAKSLATRSGATEVLVEMIYGW